MGDKMAATYRLAVTVTLVLAAGAGRGSAEMSLPGAAGKWRADPGSRAAFLAYLQSRGSGHDGPSHRARHIPLGTWRHRAMTSGHVAATVTSPTGLAAVDDVMSARRHQLGKRFKLHPFRLDRTDLTYEVMNYPSSLAREAVDRAVRRGFRLWAAHTPLKFTELPPPPPSTKSEKTRRKSAAADDAAPTTVPNIRIRFVRGAHGDKVAFDGPGGFLAHSLFPEEGAEVHFDDAERFTDGTPDGIDLYQVLVHELGHVFGLEHSEVKGAVMNALYNGYDRHFALGDDDIAAVRKLYGKS